MGYQSLESIAQLLKYVNLTKVSTMIEFLTVNKEGKKDNRVLKRLGLSAEDIKAKQYGEQFIYWNKGVSNIKTIIILENHSTFFAFKKTASSGIKIFGIEPDALIFGYGKKMD